MELILADWVIHAIVSTTGLILGLILLVTGAKLAGRIKKPTGTNIFVFHKRISILFSLFMILSYIIGVWVSFQRGTPLLLSVHGWIGLTLVIVSLLQVLPCLFHVRRPEVKRLHMIFGYTAVVLVTIQVVFGVHIALLNAVKVLVLAHSLTGALAAFSLLWVLIEMRNLTEKGIARLKIAGYTAAAFTIVGCWIVGGADYLLDYGKNVKPGILSGTQPWAHQIIMEVKEHVFLFLPIISIVLAVTVYSLGKNTLLIDDSRSKKAVILLASLTLFMVLLMFLMGLLISNAGTQGSGGI